MEEAANMKSPYVLKKQPYWVVAPDWRHDSAGVVFMHQLVHTLNEWGAEAWMVGVQRINPSLRTPVLTEDVASQHLRCGRRPIAIYPEVVSGNPLQRDTVVRFILNKPGHLGGDAQYDEKEVLYCLSTYFVPKDMRPKTKLMTFPISDPDIMKPPDPEITAREQPTGSGGGEIVYTGARATREGACVYARKYRGFGHEIDPRHRDAIDLSSQIRSPHQFAAELQKASVLYSYEPTGASIDAILCGCPVVHVLSEYQPEVPHNPWFGIHGSWSMPIHGDPVPEEDLQKKTLGLLIARAQYLRHVKGIWREIELFVQHTQKAADQET
jgi:hypothetical protein